MSFITSIGTANPSLKVSQNTIADFMIHTMKLNSSEARKLRVIFQASAIDWRYSVIDDYARSENFEFYPNSLEVEPFPSTRERSLLFKKHALPLSVAAISDCLAGRPDFELREITHLIVVSCTGMYAPGLDIDLIKALSLPTTVQRTCINFMGCYAAFNGLKAADAFCKANTNAKVLLVCTELCSIHFQREPTEDNILANALFADGSAALLVESIPRTGFNFKTAGFFCDIIPEEEAMTWHIGDHGFEMKLSSYVPSIIQRGIKKLMTSLLAKSCYQLADMSFFAIHPGGRKILEAIEKELSISKEQNRFAYEVLKNFGNMSSPTVLFVLKEIKKSLIPQDENKSVMSFAFGPGLTLESMVLKIENH